MRDALAVELLKLRRSPVAWTAGVLLVLLVPALCVGLISVVEGSGNGLLAEKVRALVVGTGWDAYSGLLAQFVASALFVGVSVVVIWCFGREFSDRTVGSLFALPVSRATIARAKLAVIIAWSVVVALSMVAVSIGYGLLAGLGAPDGNAMGGMLQLLILAVLTSLLASTLALPASVGRGYLPAIGVMVIILMSAQMAVLFEVGSWYPYAAPGLWAVSGNQPGVVVGLPQLATVPALALLIYSLIVRWWRSFELV